MIWKAWNIEKVQLQHRFEGPIIYKIQLFNSFSLCHSTACFFLFQDDGTSFGEICYTLQLAQTCFLLDAILFLILSNLLSPCQAACLYLHHSSHVFVSVSIPVRGGREGEWERGRERKREREEREKERERDGRGAEYEQSKVNKVIWWTNVFYIPLISFFFIFFLHRVNHQFWKME